MEKLNKIFGEGSNDPFPGKPWFVEFREAVDKWAEDVIKRDGKCLKCGKTSDLKARVINKELWDRHFHRHEEVSYEELLNCGITLCIDCSIARGAVMGGG